MNAPTLIVGLGGTGSSIVNKVSQMVSEEERQRIGFAVFDTDANEMKEIRENNPSIATIQTSTNLSVGEYLNIDTHSRDTWFPVNAILNSKALTEGAGQVRSISRLAFETAVSAGKMEPLHKAIEDLYKLEGSEYEQALRIIIVSSLAGGTGSGLILPVALYIKNYLATRFRQSTNITRGFFLLPEVFYGVIPGQAERNNLKCNAYAALRELDAFLMKGDRTLPEKYKESVRIQIPQVESEEYEEYDIRPYDFCFLFDAQNSDGRKLNSFSQYIDHAANCIYAQSIGPMNKRSNSSEDNTILKLTKEKGRNRYAGAGTSMLIYPMRDVKEYISLQWAKSCVSDQWMVFDRMLKQRSIENDRRRREGLKVIDIKPERHYIETVEQMANNKDAFASAIVNSCLLYDEEGNIRTIEDETGAAVRLCRWDQYISSLRNKIERENSVGSNAEIDGARSRANGDISVLDEPEGKSKSDLWEPFVNAYHSIVSYKRKVLRFTEDTAPNIAYTMFKAPNDSITSDMFDFQIETYMRSDDTNEFIHPNAIRYFLYKSMEQMKRERALVESKCKAHIDFFDNFESNNFDDKDTEDVEETVDDLAATKKVGLIDKIRRRMSSDQEDLRNAYTNYMKHIDAYRTEAIYLAVLDSGIEYITNLAKAFQSFFLSFDDKIVEMDRKIRDLEKKRNSVKGTAARYVCASEKCLREMSKNMPYTGSYITIDGKLSEQIYLNVREYAMMETQPENTEFFGKLFREGILGYYERAVMETYNDSIDMDILTAIEKEALFEEGIYDVDKVQHYIKHVIDETKILSAPFIEKPLGEELDPIPSCTYNTKLNPKDGSPKSLLIDSELEQFGGKPDPDIPMNRVLFYKSFYGLRATDLSKFAPPEKGETYSRSSGEYFKAYFDRIGTIHPNPLISRSITPHIDRWWHNASKMPDLDDAHQEEMEQEINCAFFWSLVNGYVELFDNGLNNRTYKLQPEELDMEKDSEDTELIVSNMTPCDCLYEVLDALQIYPKLVTHVNKKICSILKKEVDQNGKLEQSKLYDRIQTFKVKEFPLGEENEVRSIFDLPLLMKRSVPADIFYEEDAISILHAEIKAIKDFTARLCSDDEAPFAAGRMLRQQFDKLLQDIEKEKQYWPNIYHEELFSRICSTIRKALEGLGLSDQAEYVEKRAFDLSRS